MTTKLPRYTTGLHFPSGDFRSWEDERGYWCKTTDVSALEAENERLRDRIEFLVRHICKDTPLQWLAEELCDV